MGKKIEINVLKNKVTMVIIITLFISTIGATYAYFAFSKSDETTIHGNSATVNLGMTIEKIFPNNQEEEFLIPQQSISGSDISPLSSALKRGCLDTNNNTVCQVYKIEIKNDGGSATLQVNGSVSFYSDKALTKNSFETMPNLKWKLINSANAETPENSVLGTREDNTATSTPVIFASNITLETNETSTFYMIIWINETGTDQVDEGQEFYGKIEFTSSNGTGVTSTF